MSSVDVEKISGAIREALEAALPGVPVIESIPPSTTEADVDDLVAWLPAQLDEDAAAADGLAYWADYIERTSLDESGAEAAYLRRVLREVEAKRRILDEHQPRPVYSAAAIARYPDKNLGAIVTCERCYTIDESADRDQDEHISVDWPCPTVRLLALPYADRPGYEESWRP